ncbi:macrolide transport system ATP-binding/permease protein [Glaciihabitans tibetensis]|uniref:Macrolide transport system ATP-binding/permease protein n=1 Tax=Glaciihabitans tibetensis TaxID=1266600 RepID=A0A2T0VEA6_9MICO|nr:ATP-binding cassette domain-containing protein [Glaciihabitans tibetensis]PRY68462.1 macrolide transport system ATP-binding/permease protein [Glaciihabitans tibetensis]
MPATPSQRPTSTAQAAPVRARLVNTDDVSRKPSPTHIRVDGVSHSYGEHPVLTDLTMVVDKKDRLGLIGENGVGKSTLLRIMGGAEDPNVGRVVRPARTGLLWQEVQYLPSDTVHDLIEGGLVGLRGIERELDDAAIALSEGAGIGSGTHASEEATLARRANARYARALAAAEAADVWNVEARRDELIAGLGISGIPLDRRLDEISGGQRSRFALAALLLGRPLALLLDEPTNHLDDNATDFLRKQLINWRGPVVFASHDRAFLDEVATVLVDIDPTRDGLVRFSGTYTAYLVEKAAERKRWEHQFRTEQAELQRLEYTLSVTAREVSNDFGRKDNDKVGFDFKAGNVERAVARRVRNAEAHYLDLEENQVWAPPTQLSFGGIPKGAQSLEEEEGPLMALSGARVAGRLAIDDFKLKDNARLLVTGPNGAGKSTLLSVLAGQIKVDAAAGTLRTRKGLRVALLEQDVRFLEPHLTARTIYELKVGEKRAAALPLSSFGLLVARDIDRPVGELSIGQQRRLALALIIAKPPHVFLLDEPSNHLSLTLASELEDALGTYPGAVIVASHDRWLRQRWTGTRMELSNGQVVAADAE